MGELIHNGKMIFNITLTTRARGKKKKKKNAGRDRKEQGPEKPKGRVFDRALDIYTMYTYIV